MNILPFMGVDHWLIQQFPRASAVTRGKQKIENSLAVYDVYNQGFLVGDRMYA